MQRAEFEKLSLTHLDAMYRLALQLTRRPNEASDLVQEAYVKALRASGDFQETGGGMRPWLLRILHNAFYSQIERQKRQVAGLDDLPEPTGAEPVPGEPEPARNLAALNWEHVDERLKAAIARLRPEYRTALLLWAVEGLKYREIAGIEQVPIGTIMSRLHRARALLAEELADYAEENRLPRGSP